MKREHRDGGSLAAGGGYGSSDATSAAASSSSSFCGVGRGKMWEEQDPAGGMDDELLAALGYKVRASDMADVAHKLEQLEMVMEDGFSSLSDTVHYNPSDLSGWVQSMLSEFNPSPDPSSALFSAGDPVVSALDFSNPQIVDAQSRVVFNDDSEYDLRAIPGVAAFRPQGEDSEGSRKRLKTSIRSISNSNSSPSVASSSSPPSGAAMEAPGAGAPESARPVVVVDSQEAGVRLVHTLMACAEAVQKDNLTVAERLVQQIGLLAVSQTGAMRKVATYFAEALARRIFRIYPQVCLDSSYTDTLQMHFYESCPYLKFAHFTANQAILEAFATANRVHIIDFGLNQGMQWPALIQALALRPGGPPAFRLTGIGPPQPNNTDALQQVGWKLAQFADTLGVEFEFRGFVANSLADLEPAMLQIRPETEVVAVNSVFELHRLLARPAAINKVLASIKAMKPKIVTVVEQEANHNGPVFLDRFNEALHYYSNLFDSLEGSVPPSQDLVMSEVYLGRQICNVVACEGADRVERHETLAQWRDRFGAAGFDPVHLGSNAYKQASTLLALYAGGDGYRVEESGGSLMLGWHTRPLIATSAWRLSSSESGHRNSLP